MSACLIKTHDIQSRPFQLDKPCYSCRLQQSQHNASELLDMGCTVSQDDSRNIVSEDESSSNSFGMKPHKLSQTTYESQDSDWNRKKKNKSFFSRFSGSHKTGSTDKEYPAVLEVPESEIESWSDSNQGFKNLMASPAGRKIFETYLKGEFSAENLIFWNACNDLKSVKNQELFKEKVEIIFLNHLDSSSAHEVSLDAKVKERLMSERGNPTKTIFDEAQGKIYSLMHRDSYSRFLVSNFYEKLLNKGKAIILPRSAGDSERTDSVDLPVNDKPASGEEGQSETKEVTVLRPMSEERQRAIDNLEMSTLDYETEKLILFSK